MHTSLNSLHGDLVATITAALRQKLSSNRGTFPPFRLTPVATDLANCLVAGDEQQAYTLGSALGKEGLSQLSLIAAQTAALQLIAHQATQEHMGELIGQVSGSLGAAMTGLAATDLEEVQRQRDEIERAFRNVVAQQQEEEYRLRDAIRELSTPIIPVYEGILALPLVGAVDSRRATEITERLLEAIAEHQAEIVILDITGVSIIDTSTANHLLMTTRAASLLGSQIVLTGIGVEVAQSVVHLGVDLHGIVTRANLQDGLTYALKCFGLSVGTLT